MNPKLALGYSSVIALTTAVWSIVAGVYTTKPGPFYLTNMFLDVWLSTLCFFCCLQTFYLVGKPAEDINRYFGFQIFGFGILSLCGLIMVITYSAGARAGVVPLAVFLLTINILNCYLLLQRRNSSIKGISPVTTDVKGLANFKSSNPKIYKCATGCNCCLFGATILFMLLLTYSSFYFLIDNLVYPPRGKFVTLTTPEGKPQNLHYVCKGPVNASQPTIWLAADATHGALDFYGLLLEFEKLSRRACSFDYAGQGKSDYFYADQNLAFDPAYFKQLLDTTKECSSTLKCVFIGWGGGGESVFEFALKYPDYVSALGYIDVYPKDYEYQVIQDKEGKSDADIQSYKTIVCNLRAGVSDTYTGLAVPWGLMVIFYGGPYEPASFRSEYQSTYLTDKMWPIQKLAIKLMLKDPKTVRENRDYFNPSRLQPGMKIVHLISNPNITMLCNLKNVALDSKDCLDLQAQNDYGYKARRDISTVAVNITTLSGQGAFMVIPNVYAKEFANLL